MLHGELLLQAGEFAGEVVDGEFEADGFAVAGVAADFIHFEDEDGLSGPVVEDLNGAPEDGAAALGVEAGDECTAGVSHIDHRRGDDHLVGREAGVGNDSCAFLVLLVEVLDEIIADTGFLIGPVTDPFFAARFLPFEEIDAFDGRLCVVELDLEGVGLVLKDGDTPGDGVEVVFGKSHCGDQEGCRDEEGFFHFN